MIASSCQRHPVLTPAGWHGAVIALSFCGCSSESLSPAPPPTPPPVVTAIAAGLHHACALMTDGTMRCWGDNRVLELGHGCTAGGPAATQCHVAERVSDDELFEAPFEEVADMALGSNRSCAIVADGSVWCWGDNRFGDFGTGDYGSAVTFPPVETLLQDVAELSLGDSSCAKLGDESLWCWGRWSDEPASHTPVRSPWVQEVGALPARDPECVIGTEGWVLCRGPNDHGQVGDGTFEDREFYVTLYDIDDAVDVARVGRLASCALGEEGAVACWGASGTLGSWTAEDSSEPVPVPLSRPALGIAGAAEAGSACAVVEDGTLSCWGDNHWGQLGDGTTHDRLTPTPVVGLDEVEQVAMGSDFTCALRADHTVWCWGDNFYGQLGSGYQDGPRGEDYARASALPVRVVFQDELAAAGR